MLHGLLLVNKDPGMTSHDVVAKTRRILKIKSVGHTGTLDPMASGLMVLLIGEATKLSQYILDGDKAYQAQVLFGKTSDTLDATGTILSENKFVSAETEVVKKVEELVGTFELPVPVYSAVKVQGKELHKYARSDQEVVIPQKKMTFYKASILSLDGERLEVYIRCSKGSYIRSWAHQLGQNLGCGALLSGLRRVESAPYFVDKSLTLAELESQFKGQLEGLPNYVPMDQALPHFTSLRVQGQDLHLIAHGNISNSLKSQLISMYRPGVPLQVKILHPNLPQILALIELEEGEGFKIKRVFRY